MKKKVIILSIVLIGIISIITINLNKNKQEEHIYEVITYIDGKLATSFPESTAGYKVNNISCTNGVTASFNHSTWRLEVSNIISNTTCTIEFESNNNKRFNEYLKDKVCKTTPTTDDAAKDCLVNENGLRYEGEDPNNYVMFNDELWRIIGVFNIAKSDGTAEDLVKIIRNDTLDGLAWHSSTSNLTWSTSILQQELNEENNSYLYSKDRTCNIYETSVTKTCKFSKSGIKSIARTKIENVRWNIGKGLIKNAGETYIEEAKTLWIGKVGLISTSDYGYSVLASNCARSTGLASYNGGTCAGKNWLYIDGFQWTINPASDSPTLVMLVFDSGEVSRHVSHTPVSGYGVRPSVYLKSSVRYISGSGTYSDPYIIS